MKLIGIILFVGVLLTLGHAVNTNQFKDDPNNQMMTWGCIGLLLILGMAAVAGMLQ